MVHKMMLASSLVVLLHLIHLAHGTPNGKLCSPIDNAPGCKCKSSKGTIDLSPLSSDNGPMFADFSDPNGFLYDFNPCKTFTASAACTDVYICQESNFKDDTYAIADRGDEGIYIDDATGVPYIYYTGPTDRETFVELVCDEELEVPFVSTLGDSKRLLVYEVTLTSKLACFQGGGGGTEAGAAGLVLIFLSLVGIAMYFLIGGIIQAVHFKKTGTDLIVNKVFWFALPGLIKEGFIFTFGPCIAFIRQKIAEKKGGYKQEGL